MSFLNAAQRRSLKRQMRYVELLNRARTENVTKDQMKAIVKSEKEKKKETEERRRNEKRKRAHDEPNVEYELDLNGRRIGAARAKRISLETARTDEIVLSGDDDMTTKKDPIWLPQIIEGLTCRCQSQNIFRRRQLNSMSYGVTKMIPLMRTEVMQLRDRDQKEIRRRWKETTVTSNYFGSNQKDSTSELKVPPSSWYSPSSSPSSSSSFSSSSNSFASKLRSSSKPLSSSSSSSIDSKSKTDPCLNGSDTDTRFDTTPRGDTGEEPSSTRKL